VGLFARKSVAGGDADALDGAEADLQRLTDTQRDLAEQLEAARKDSRECRDAHRRALVEAPDKAAGLGAQALAARTKLEGLEANAVDLDAELGEAQVRVAQLRTVADREHRAGAIDTALARQGEAMAIFEPAARELIAALRAPEFGVAIAGTAQRFEAFIEQAVKQITYDRD
jgi:hypothetical protein